jgi:hypothetical protein
MYRAACKETCSITDVLEFLWRQGGPSPFWLFAQLGDGFDPALGNFDATPWPSLFASDFRGAA